jgi:hypothetical protein
MLKAFLCDKGVSRVDTGSANHVRNLPLLKSEWVEMGDQPLLAVERTVERVRGRWPLSSPCRRRRWPEGQALQGPSVLG